MQIGIIGTGRIASGVGQRLINAGHAVFFGSRDASKAQTVAQAIGAQGGTQAEAVSFGEVIILAIPFGSVAEVVGDLPGLKGKIVIETANDLQGTDPLSTTERVQALLPDSKVVKAFNHIFSQVIANPDAQGLTAFIAGNDTAAKAVVKTLLESISFEVVDVGGAKEAMHLDHLVRFIVYLGYNHGMGTSMAFKLVQV